MADHFLDMSPPEHLEDEALLIETAGEMPEVALAESLHHLGPLPAADLRALRAATARAYLRLLVRDLDYANVGRPHFRGLERALANLGRLRLFLASINELLSQQVMTKLRGMLEVFLAREKAALDAGRPYAGSDGDSARRLVAELGLDAGEHQPVLSSMDRLPSPDFKALAALATLQRAGGVGKRRQQSVDGVVTISVLDQNGRPAATVRLETIGPAGVEDSVLRRRVEDVWSLLRLPPAP